MEIIKDGNREDIYYVAYYMMIQAFSSPTILEGLEKSLFLAKIFLKADDVVLFKKNNDDIYEHILNQPYMIGDSNFVSKLLEYFTDVVEQDTFCYVGSSNQSSDVFQGISFLSVPSHNSQYVLAFTNTKLSMDDYVVQVLSQTFSMVLDKLELYDELKKESTKDYLTGLDNRKSYSDRMKIIDQNDDEYYYMLFDLFRLKHINDQYSHALGDQYIIETAKILKKYFPKSIVQKNKHGKVQKESAGGCVYRIGGDEFAVIATKDAYEDILERAKLAIDEVRHIQLDVDDPLLLGLNFGFAYRNKSQKSVELYLEADYYLSKDKAKMYRDYRIERRK